jgi:hypothetical protein
MCSSRVPAVPRDAPEGLGEIPCDGLDAHFIKAIRPVEPGEPELPVRYRAPDLQQVRARVGGIVHLPE